MMTEFDKMTCEEIEKEKKVIAKIIDKNIFLSGLQKLTKIQLIILVNDLVERLDITINLNDDCDIDERDFKDMGWDYKCLLIETLYPNYFMEVDDEED